MQHINTSGKNEDPQKYPLSILDVESTLKICLDTISQTIQNQAVVGLKKEGIKTLCERKTLTICYRLHVKCPSRAHVS